MRELCKIDLKDLLFLDIETCGRFSSLAESDPIYWKAFESFSARLAPDKTLEEVFERTGLYPEFGRVACISLGFEYKGQLRLKSFISESEEEILVECLTMINDNFSDRRLCGYNIANFDIPYLGKRSLVYDIPIIDKLDMTGLKPWESSTVDLLKIYQQGSHDRLPTLDAVCMSLGIPSPKQDFHASEVHAAFWNKKFKEISKYCEGDVETVYKLFKKMKCC